MKELFSYFRNRKAVIFWELEFYPRVRIENIFHSLYQAIQGQSAAAWPK